MKSLGGIELPELPVAGLKHVRDLLYFEGPLISQHAHPNGDTYLYYWCDCDKKLNRWMVLRVNEASVLSLINRFVPLDHVIPKACRDDFVYFIDTDGKEEREVRMVPVQEIPADYKPSAGAYLEAESRQAEERSFSVVVDGGWSAATLGEFPRIFGKAYSLLYSLNVLHLPKFEGYPWRGGFSAMHFFDWLGKRVPFTDRPSIAAMQYASPGFMRFSLNGPTAREIAECIACYSVDQNKMSEAHSALFAYIREHKLNEDAHIEWSKHDQFLKQKAEEILSGFKPIDAASFVTACERPFEAAKIAGTFYRFIKRLSQFQDDGLVQFASPAR